MCIRDRDRIDRFVDENPELDGTIKIDDLKGDGDHYAAYIETSSFKGLSKVKQHQMVYKALKGKMGYDLHALALNTSEPK